LKNDLFTRATEARHAANEQTRKLRALYTQGLDADNLTASEKRKLDAQIRDGEADLARLEREAERLEAVVSARQLVPPTAADAVGRMGDGAKPWPAVRNELAYSDFTYRPDGEFSFVRDAIFAKDDPSAQARLQKNQEETVGEMVRRGDVTTGDPGLGSIVPPLYLSDAFADYPRSGRPFADAVGARRLPDAGMTVSVPKLATGTAVGSQVNQADNVTEQDPDADLLTCPVVTIAGQVDVSRQAFDRTIPQADVVLIRDLMAAYDAQLDNQLLNGSGTSGQHKGLLKVASTSNVVYNDASPTGVKAVKKIGAASSAVASSRFLTPDAILLHPRRAYDLGTQYDATNPVLPAGSTIARAVGTQVGGMADNILGMRVVVDPNVTTAYNASSQDVILVVRLEDFMLWESPVRAFRFQEVLSGTLQVRLQVFSYSAWMPDRYPNGIGLVQGTGLTTPTFT
jgi:HK97 family phage major capsid protein